MLRKHVVWAVFRRNFISYFSQPTGYVFITVFIMLSSALAFWPAAFFANNLANLDTLNEWFPYLLLFFVPAVTMGIWSEERKQGTDELLMTLPASDMELLLGKYLAALGTYSVALGFSVTHIIVLGFLGEPDVGVMVGTYMGYWFLGAALLASGMAVSHLTTSMTVAFILGALLCAVPVVMSEMGGAVAETGVRGAFDDLSSGVLSLSAVLYFVAFAALFLYANIILLARRHVRNELTWLHMAGRFLSLLVIAVCLSILSGRLGWRLDLTYERLHSLTKETRDMLRKVDADRPVYIHAFVSPEVPTSYVQTRENLLGLLREYDAMGGRRIRVRIVETERYSDEAREAEQSFGIRPVELFDMQDGRATRNNATFMGIAFICGTEQNVIPFLHRGLSVEYELTRSIGVVAGEKRKKVGIASTDAKLFGGMNFQTFSQTPSWSIVEELRKQYEVTQVSLDQPVPAGLDSLMVALPSSLTQPQMDNLMGYIRKGGATLLFDDPFPRFNPQLQPNLPKPSPGGGRSPFMPAPPPSQPKGNIREFMDTLGVSWISDVIVWDTYNPHPVYGDVPREIVFAGSSSFNEKEAVSSGLQEMAFLWGGELQARPGSELTFTPLIQSSPQAGALPSNLIFQRGFMGQMSQNPNPPYGLPSGRKILAARVQGRLAPAPKPPGEKGPTGNPQDGSVNLIVVADLDCISEMFFRMRQDNPDGVAFDNVTFVLNCVDILAGDESYVALRKRRPKHRTLTAVEARQEAFNKKLLEVKKAEEDKAKKAIDKAQADLDKKVDEIQKAELDEGTRRMRLDYVERVENRRLEIRRKQIEDERDAAIERATTERNQSVRRIERGIKAMAFALPPILPFVIALVVWIRRLGREGRTL